MDSFLSEKDYESLPHILVVDDDDRIRDLLVQYLNEHEFVAFGAPDAITAKQTLKILQADALVLDVMMPGQDGMSLTQELREGESNLPVLLLTAMGEIDDKIKGLSVGADDYLTKPFDPRELALRLQAILRRREAISESEKKILKIGRWEFNGDFKELVDGQEVVKLTDVEVTLVNALSQNLGDLISRDDIATACGIDPDKRTIDVQVTRLRKKLEDDSQNTRYLQTIRGKGYILRGEYL